MNIVKKLSVTFGLLALCFILPVFAGEQVKKVRVTRPQMFEFEDRLELQGTVEAVNVARVSARIPGPIDEIFVKEGDRVVANQTKLFVIDPLKLEMNLEISKQNLAIAALSLKEKEARMKQAAADLEKSRVDAERFRLLWEDKSTSQDNYEKAQLKFKVSEATVEHIQTLIDLDREQHKKAALALTIAEKDFKDSTVFAPIDGIVSAKLQEPGEIAAPGKPIIIIKNPDQTEVAAFAPAEYYHRITARTTDAEISSCANNKIFAKVSYKSPEIMPELRTFQIKCENTANDPSMVPGALAKLSLILDSRKGLALPSSAILNRGGNKVVFAVNGNKAKMITVQTGLENNGLTEITAGDINLETLVIVRGQHLINDNSPIETVLREIK